MKKKKTCAKCSTSKKKIPLKRQVMLQRCMRCREESVGKQNYVPTAGKKKLSTKFNFNLHQSLQLLNLVFENKLPFFFFFALSVRYLWPSMGQKIIPCPF